MWYLTGALKNVIEKDELGFILLSFPLVDLEVSKQYFKLLGGLWLNWFNKFWKHFSVLGILWFSGMESSFLPCLDCYLTQILQVSERIVLLLWSLGLLLYLFRHLIYILLRSFANYLKLYFSISLLSSLGDLLEAIEPSFSYWKSETKKDFPIIFCYLTKTISFQAPILKYTSIYYIFS